MWGAECLLAVFEDRMVGKCIELRSHEPIEKGDTLFSARLTALLRR
jgi:hypothetical protein